MTPQIALDLSLDGISALSRAENGVWWREGVVRLDAPDMSERLARLRDICAARVGDDFTSILIIPDSQLLFTSLERDDRDPKVTIRALLRGRTPYEVEDLAFDYLQRGDRLQVAVIALETLLEAEGFAAGFGFRPVALVGNPTDPIYPGLPHFGQTGIAAEMLNGDKLNLDIEHGFEIIPAPTPPAMPEPESAPAPEVTEPAIAEAESTAPDETAPELAEVPLAVVATTENVVPDTPEPEALPDTQPDVRADFRHEEPAINADFETAVTDHDTPQDDPADPAPLEDPLPESAAAADLPVSVNHFAPEGTGDTTPVFSRSPGTPSRPTAEGPAFSTRRQGAKVPASPVTDALNRITPRLSNPVGTATPPATVPKVEAPRPPTITPPEAPVNVATTPAVDAVKPPAPSDTTAPTRQPGTLTVPPVLAGAMAARKGPDKPVDKDAPPPTKNQIESADEEAVALALPGLAREQAARPKRAGGGRLGLYMTFSLLVLMGLVALWSVLQGDDSASEITQGAIADAPAQAIATTDETAALIPAPQSDAAVATDAPLTTAPERDLAALLPNASVYGGGGVGDTSVVTPPDPTVEDVPQSADSPPVDAATPTGTPADEEIAATSTDSDPAATTEPVAPTADVVKTPEGSIEGGAPAVALTTPETTPDVNQTETSGPFETAGTFDQGPALPDAPEPGAADDVYIASIDPERTDGDAIALPTVAPPADGFAPQPVPAPAGTEFDTTADGLVVASTSGTLAPGGYTVVSGRPEIFPEPRPGTAEPVAPIADAPAVEDDAARAELRRTRPIERPSDAAAQVERQDFNGLSREEINRTRPRQRPASISDAALREAEEVAAEAERAATEAEQDAAVQAAAAAASASLANGATDPASSVPSTPTSAFALGQSDRPRTRPRSVERAAARIVTQRREQASAATASSSSSEAAASTASRSNQTIRSAGGSVARAATQQNAIRLRDVNLIGVYGRPNARRALVRLGNGRYVKVEVGDRLDRGRVTAIGDNQLIYQRSGRNVTLSLPNA